MFRTFSLTAAAALLAMPAFACDGFEAHDAYARSSTSMSQSGAVFMMMHNHGDADCRLTAARSDVAQRVELHTHLTDDNGVMRMVEVEEGFALPAGGEHALARGGDHVMLMGLHDALEQGESLTLTLVFEDGSETELEVPVDNQRMPASGSMGHGTMDHGSMDHGHEEEHSHNHDH